MQPLQYPFFSSISYAWTSHDLFYRSLHNKFKTSCKFHCLSDFLYYYLHVKSCCPSSSRMPTTCSLTICRAFFNFCTKKITWFIGELTVCQLKFKLLIHMIIKQFCNNNKSHVLFREICFPARPIRIGQDFVKLPIHNCPESFFQYIFFV